MNNGASGIIYIAVFDVSENQKVEIGIHQYGESNITQTCISLLEQKKINEVILYDITYFFKTIEVYFSLFDEEKKKQLEHLGLSKISAKIDKILNSEI